MQDTRGDFLLDRCIADSKNSKNSRGWFRCYVSAGEQIFPRLHLRQSAVMKRQVAVRLAFPV